MVPGSYYRYVAYIGTVHVTQLPWSLEAIIDTLLAMVFHDSYEGNCVRTNMAIKTTIYNLYFQVKNPFSRNEET